MVDVTVNLNIDGVLSRLDNIHADLQAIATDLSSGGIAATQAGMSTSIGSIVGPVGNIASALAQMVANLVTGTDLQAINTTLGTIDYTQQITNMRLQSVANTLATAEVDLSQIRSDTYAISSSASNAVTQLGNIDTDVSHIASRLGNPQQTVAQALSDAASAITGRLDTDMTTLGTQIVGIGSTLQTQTQALQGTIHTEIGAHLASGLEGTVAGTIATINNTLASDLQVIADRLAVSGHNIGGDAGSAAGTVAQHLDALIQALNGNGNNTIFAAIGSLSSHLDSIDTDTQGVHTGINSLRDTLAPLLSPGGSSIEGALAQLHTDVTSGPGYLKLLSTVDPGTPTGLANVLSQLRGDTNNLQVISFMSMLQNGTRDGNGLVNGGVSWLSEVNDTFGLVAQQEQTAEVFGPNGLMMTLTSSGLPIYPEGGGS